MKPTFVLLSALSLAALTHAQTQEDKVTLPQDPQFVVSSQGDCVVLGPKKHLLNGQITEVIPSLEGKCAVAKRIVLTPPQYLDLIAGKNPRPLDTRITVVDVATGRSADFPYDPAKVQIHVLSVSESGLALLQVNDGAGDQIVTLSLSGRIRVVSNPPPHSIVFGIAFSVPNSKSLLLVVLKFVEDGRFGQMVPKTELVQEIDAQGNVIRDLSKFAQGLTDVRPSPNNPNIAVASIDGKWFNLDLNTGQRTPIDPPDYTNSTPQKDARSELDCIQSKHGDDNLWKLAFLEDHSTKNPASQIKSTKPKSALVGTNLSHALLNSTQTALFLSDSGGLDAIPIQPVDLDAYNALMKDKAKKEAINKAKQMGTAMAIYCADYDDSFPLSNGWADAVYPYCKNRDLMDGFQYLLNGENAASFDEPTKTQLGVVSTPYGEAVVFADTHVEWRDNKPPSALLLTLLADPKSYVR